MRTFVSMIISHKYSTCVIAKTTQNRYTLPTYVLLGVGCNNAVVAQLVRASACHAEGRGFESLRPRKRKALRGFSRFGAVEMCTLNYFSTVDTPAKIQTPLRH